MNFGETGSFLVGSLLGLFVGIIGAIYIIVNFSQSRRRSKEDLEVPSIAESKLDFLRLKSFTILSRLQGIVGVADLALAGSKDLTKNDLKIISEGAKQISNLLSEALNLHVNQIKIEDHPTPLASTRRVLIVDDNEIMRETCAEILRAMNIEFDIAKDGKDGVEKVKVKDYGLVIMDCEMPVLDGYQATLQIRGLNGKKATTNILGFTANALRGAEQKCLAVGMNFYISKPVQLSELKSAISRFIPVT